MQYSSTSTSSNTIDLNTQDWIRVTTTAGSGTNAAGWYSVNWGPTIKKDPTDQDRFYSRTIGKYLDKNKILVPDKPRNCWLETIELFSHSQVLLHGMFRGKEGAIMALTSFRSKTDFEKKMFIFLANKVYTEDISERNRS